MKSMNRDDLLAALQVQFPRAWFKRGEEFDGRKNSIWTGEGSFIGDDHYVRGIFEYYDSEPVDPEFNAFIEPRGWYVEWYDAGTVFLYPLHELAEPGESVLPPFNGGTVSSELLKELTLAGPARDDPAHPAPGVTNLGALLRAKLDRAEETVPHQAPAPRVTVEGADLELLTRLAEDHCEALTRYLTAAICDGDLDAAERTLPKLKQAKGVYDKLMVAQGQIDRN